MGQYVHFRHSIFHWSLDKLLVTDSTYFIAMLVNKSGKNRIAHQLLVASISFSFQFLAGIVLLNISKHNYINLIQTYIHKVHIILYRSKWSWKPKWFMGSLSDTQAFDMEIENNKRVQRGCNIRYAVDNQLQWILNWNQMSYCRTTSCIGNTAHDLLTHWGRDKIYTILQTTFQMQFLE